MLGFLLLAHVKQLFLRLRVKARNQTQFVLTNAWALDTGYQLPCIKQTIPHHLLNQYGIPSIPYFK